MSKADTAGTVSKSMNLRYDGGSAALDTEGMTANEVLRVLGTAVGGLVLDGTALGEITADEAGEAIGHALTIIEHYATEQLSIGYWTK